METNSTPLPLPPVEEDPRIGVYICRCGGNISDYLNTDRMAQAVASLPGVAVASVDTFFCSDPGQNRIEQDVRQGKVNRVVVASCSPFLHELTFQSAVKRGGLNPYLYNHVNIREQGSWAHGHQGEEGNKLALRMIAAGVGKVRHLEPLEKIRLPGKQRALVIGGGVAGMKAAADVARRGIDVLLVEEAPALGGRAAELGKVYPSSQEARDLVARLKADLAGLTNAVVLTSARIKSIAGFIGNYQVVVEQGGQESTHGLGAIIIAAGFDPYQPGPGEYGFGDPRVTTLPEFAKALRDQGDGRLAWNGKPVRSVAFIHCVGSRQCEGCHAPQADGRLNDYCSRVCCSSILRTAVELRQRFPETRVFDFYQDIRTYGRGQEDIYSAASESGVTFFRWKAEEPPVVATGPEVTVTVKDCLTFGEELEVPVDLVVLGVGMMPRARRDFVEMLKLPLGADRFLQEVHPKLRPVEVAVSGILLAGTAQGPMSIEESLCAASAAAAKASVLLARDFTELEPFVARVRPEACVGCNACVEECFYAGAIRLETTTRDGQEARVAVVNAGLCKGCGACVAVCPTRALDVQGWTLDQFDSMIDGLTTELELAPA